MDENKTSTEVDNLCTISYDRLRNLLKELNPTYDSVALDNSLAKIISKFSSTGIPKLITDWSTCNKCRLHNCRTNVVVGNGASNASILIIGEAPGPTEDELMVGFCGDSGKVLRELLTKLSFNIIDDIFFTNIVSCIPKDSKSSTFRAPVVSEIEACAPRLEALIDSLPNLKSIILLGKTSYSGFKYLFSNPNSISYTTINNTFKITDNIGKTDLKFKDKNILIYTTFHPSFIMRQERQKEYNKIYQSWIDSFKLIKKDLKEI